MCTTVRLGGFGAVPVVNSKNVQQSQREKQKKKKKQSQDIEVQPCILPDYSSYFCKRVTHSKVHSLKKWWVQYYSVPVRQNSLV